MADPFHDALCAAKRPTAGERELETVKAMLEAGADVNQCDCSISKTPLDCCAAYSGTCSEHLMSKPMEAVMRLLFAHGANPNRKDGQGWTMIHQAAWYGDLNFIRLAVDCGKGDISSRNNLGQQPVDLAAVKNHTAITSYIDTHSCDLAAICRGVIRQTLGKRCGQLNKLHLPPRLKLFLNYNTPYPGFTSVLVPPAPWTAAELHQHQVQGTALREFIMKHGSQDFLQEHSSSLGREGTSTDQEHCSSLGREGTSTDQEHSSSLGREETSEHSSSLGTEETSTDQEHSSSLGTEETLELVQLFQDMYLWEAFKIVAYEEPMPRKPRYSLEKKAKISSHQSVQPETFHSNETNEITFI